MGGSDCELLRDGWLAQPANAWSSLAYLLAAAWVLRRDRHGAAGLGAAALATVAVGSAAYHGPQPAGAEVVHDASITALLVALLLNAAEREVRRPAVVLLAVGVGVTAVAPALDGAVHAGLAVAVAVAEVRRRRRRTGPPSTADRVAIVALAVGAALFALGRTGGPLCRPASVLQPHAGWHVATAVAAAAALAGGRRTPAA